MNRAVGFIGIGNMGRPMSRNLAAAGFDVTVFDLNVNAARAHADANGLTAVETMAGLAGCDRIVTMLPDGKAVRAAMLGENGAAPHLAAGTLLIDMSSADPVGTQELGAELAAKGLAMVDAPVSGAVPRAEDGTLTIMVGSDDPALAERARPVLAGMGKEIVQTGPLGSGHAMKALNNYVAATGFAAVSEALIVGQKFGLAPGKMVEIMNTSTGRNFMTDLVMKPHVLDEAFATGFALALLSKDVGIAEDLASSLDMDARLLHTSAAMWREALADLPTGADNSEAYKAWRDRMSGGAT